MNKLLATALVSLAALGITASNASAGILSKLFCHDSYSVKVKIKPYNAFTPGCSGCLTCNGGACLPGFGGHDPQCAHGGDGYMFAGQGHNPTFINGGVLPPGAVIVNPNTPTTTGTPAPATAQPTNPVAVPRAFVPNAYPYGYQPNVGYNGNVPAQPQGWNGAR